MPAHALVMGRIFVAPDWGVKMRQFALDLGRRPRAGMDLHHALTRGYQAHVATWKASPGRAVQGLGGWQSCGMAGIIGAFSINQSKPLTPSNVFPTIPDQAHTPKGMPGTARAGS